MNQNSGQWGVGLLIGIVLGIFIGASFEPSQGEYEAALGRCEVVRDDYVVALEDAKGQCEVVRDGYVVALEDANRNIQEANYQLADGQSYAWLSYEDMGYLLENLYEVDEIDDHGTICY